MNVRPPIAALLLFAAAGCGGTAPGGTQSITVHTSRIASQADLLRVQLVAHLGAIQSAPDLAAISDQEAQFSTTTAATFGALDEELGDIGSCSDPAGRAPDVEEVRKLVDAARVVVAAHAPAMSQAQTTAQAISVENDFQSAMAPLPPEIVDAAGRMSKLTDVTCPLETDGDESQAAAQAATSASSEPNFRWGGCDCGRPPDPLPRAFAPLPLLLGLGAWMTRRAGA